MMFGIVQYSDLAAAARRYERALALEPTNSTILGNASTLLFSLGRVDQAIVLDEYIAARDPRNAVAHFGLATSYRYAGRLGLRWRTTRLATQKPLTRSWPSLSEGLSGTLPITLPMYSPSQLDAIDFEVRTPSASP